MRRSRVLIESNTLICVDAFSVWGLTAIYIPAVGAVCPNNAIRLFLPDSFTRQVLWKLLKVVKFGDVVSYQQLAALAGSPNAARAVGGAMRSNPVSSCPRGDGSACRVGTCAPALLSGAQVSFNLSVFPRQPVLWWVGREEAFVRGSPARFW